MRGLRTRAVHVGQTPDPVTGAVVPPIHLASTFVMDEVGVTRAGYDYSRSGNPTRDAFQVALANLESGGEAVAFPSGLGAEDTLIRALTRPGDHILAGTDVYGGTGRLLRSVLPAEGRTVARVDTTDREAVRAALAERRARLVWVETPSNPRLEISDIAVLAGIVHSAGGWLVVDNTFATPVFQRPIKLGADIVVHSTTKFVGGHSDLVGGAVVLSPGLALPEAGLSGSRSAGDELRWWQNATGAVPGVFDCWLAHRGLKTLAVRVEAAAKSAGTIAAALETMPGVRRVWYPGLASHPAYATAVRQMSGFGSVISFEMGSPGAARLVAESTEIFSLAVSLGAVESLIEYPYAMTHGVLAGTPDAAPDTLVRLAVGLEDPGDLIGDLVQAIRRAGRG